MEDISNFLKKINTMASRRIRTKIHPTINIETTELEEMANEEMRTEGTSQRNDDEADEEEYEI